MGEKVTGISSSMTSDCNSSRKRETIAGYKLTTSLCKTPPKKGQKKGNTTEKIKDEETRRGRRNTH